MVRRIILNREIYAKKISISPLIPLSLDRERVRVRVENS
jgi:hypothetical protein